MTYNYIATFCRKNTTLTNIHILRLQQTVNMKSFFILIKSMSQPPLFSPVFKLPIQYLDKEKIHTLSPIVCDDLELATTMNRHMFRPNDIFAEQMTLEWAKSYTTDVLFLTDTQRVIQTIATMDTTANTPLTEHCADEYPPSRLNERINHIWKSMKQDDSFLDKYGYMDWNMLLHLNHSPTFLQGLTMMQLMTPIYNLVVPVIILIIPFALLKLQGIPLSMTSYLDVLKTIAKNSSIGKMFMNGGSVNSANIGYVAMSAGFYTYQMYQSITSSIKFYKHIRNINDDLNVLKTFVRQTKENMDNFVHCNQDKKTYHLFCQDVAKHSAVLAKIAQELAPITPHKIINQLGALGVLLKCYYVLHSNAEYEESMRYMMGFTGYLDNLKGVYENIKRRHIHFAQFSKEDAKCAVKGQYYPPFIGKPHVKNTCNLSTNTIITGVNGSGKTTVLKTTLLNILYSQQLGCGFYRSFVLCPYTNMHSYLNIPDTSGRDSLFQAETRRCKEIIDAVGEMMDDEVGNHPRQNMERKRSVLENIDDNDEPRRHFCIFDELYSGTNPSEASKCACALLQYLAKHDNVNFMLTTHYVSICKKMKIKCANGGKRGVDNYKMLVEHDEKSGRIKYKYMMKRGICKIEGAVNVLKQMDYPDEIIRCVENG